MNTNSTTKLFSDSGQKCYDSSRTDSGFLSGANLASEENLSSEDLSTGEPLQSLVKEIPNKNNALHMQIDSGVDLGLNEQFSGLTLEQQLCVKDFVNSAKCKHLSDSSEIKTNNIISTSKNENISKIVITHPWEFYFQQDEEGDTQLHIAVIQGFVEVVYSLVRIIPHPCFLDILNDIIQSPLHLAVLTEQPEIVRLLVVAGACVDTRDRYGNTALHLACQTGSLECVKSLTKPISVSEITNANLLYSGYTQQVPQDFEERNYDGETCLHLAAYGGHLDILRHLIWFGANINSRENKSGGTILHYAVETQNQKLLHFLLNECTFGSDGLLLDTRNYAGHTAYQLARMVDITIANDLLCKGAQFDVDDLDEEDHPDHNEEDMDEENNELDCIHSEARDYQRSMGTLSV